MSGEMELLLREVGLDMASGIEVGNDEGFVLSGEAFAGPSTPTKSPPRRTDKPAGPSRESPFRRKTSPPIEKPVQRPKKTSCPGRRFRTCELPDFAL